MLFGWFALIAGLTLSGVAMYFSIIGWAEIFSASALSAMIYCGTLEVSKLIAVSWLKFNWSRVPIAMKFLMTSVVVILMIITSLGVFGYLAKAHSATALTGQVNVIQLRDLTKVIESSDKELTILAQQMNSLDQAIQVLVSAGRIRGENGSEAMRASQSSERERINSAIALASATRKAAEIKKLSIETDQAKLSAELGPIKYVAELFYGAEPPASVMEKVVTIIITTIVSISDPFAVMLLMAAQMSFNWSKPETEVVSYDSKDSVITGATPEDSIETLHNTDKISDNESHSLEDTHVSCEPQKNIDDECSKYDIAMSYCKQLTPNDSGTPCDGKLDTHDLNEKFKMIADAYLTK